VDSGVHTDELADTLSGPKCVVTEVWPRCPRCLTSQDVCVGGWGIPTGGGIPRGWGIPMGGAFQGWEHSKGGGIPKGGHSKWGGARLKPWPRVQVAERTDALPRARIHGGCPGCERTECERV